MQVRLIQAEAGTASLGSRNSSSSDRTPHYLLSTCQALGSSKMGESAALSSFCTMNLRVRPIAARVVQ